MLWAGGSLHHLPRAGGALVHGLSGDLLPLSWQLASLAAHTAAESQQKTRSCCLASLAPLPSAVLLPLQEQHSYVSELTLFPNNTSQASE